MRAWARPTGWRAEATTSPPRPTGNFALKKVLEAFLNQSALRAGTKIYVFVDSINASDRSLIRAASMLGRFGNVASP
jgi:hypothetical protein